MKRDPGAAGPQALAAAISAAVGGTSGPALGQDDAALGEIIVTATRRAERLQDVPESISAFDSEAIAARGLQQMEDYAKFIPGLSLGVREPGGTAIIFRGVATSGVQFGSVSSAALYLDEQPITAAGRNPDPRLVDIERLEALRGPQGTLYGASSQSGTLRIITNKPDTSGFSAWADVQASQIDDGDAGYDVAGMLNVPLGDRLALRLVGFAAEDAGFIDNVLGSSQGQTFDNADRLEEDVNTVETTGARAALRWEISDAFSATASAIVQSKSADGHGDVNLDVDDLQQLRFEDESVDDDWYQLALTLDASLPFGDLIVSGSYFDRDFHYEADATDYEFNFNCPAYDADGNPNPPPPACVPAAVTYDFGGDPRGFAVNDEATEETTFEARLQSPGASDSRWSWLIGVFYSERDEHTEFDSYVRDYPDTPSWQEFYNLYGIAPTNRWFLGRYDVELDEKAVFGELSFDLTENFTITAGGRWFDYERSFRQTQDQPEGVETLDGNQQTSEDGTVGKLNLTYRLDEDRLVYATYSEGFRVGGSNPLKAESTLPRDYESDELQNYEIGAKTEWLDNTLRFNVAAYLMKWDDIQVQVEDPGEPVGSDVEFFQLGFVNFPQAEITGIEGDFALRAGEHWSLEGAFSWNDAEISEASTLTTTNGVETFTFTVEDGARLPLTPDWSASLGIEFRSGGELLGGEPFARFDYAYVGDSVNSLAGIESVVSGAPVETQDAYSTGDVRVGIEAESWTASLFVDNVWDERAELFISNRWAKQRVSVNTPRTFGVQFRYEF
jgi:outer membrane receptor protein involved in Fe transport